MTKLQEKKLTCYKAYVVLWKKNIVKRYLITMNLSYIFTFLNFLYNVTTIIARAYRLTVAMMYT